MPRKVTAWACKFKCGRRVTTHKADVTAHEEWCWSNPNLKTCKTCEHDQRDEDGFYCEIDANDTPKPIRRMCPKWKLI